MTVTRTCVVPAPFGVISGLRVLYCRECKYGIVVAEARSHLDEHHKGVYDTDEVVSLVDACAEDQRLLARDVDKNDLPAFHEPALAFKELAPARSDGVKCKHCQHVTSGTSAITTMGQHLEREHHEALQDGDMGKDKDGVACSSAHYDVSVWWQRLFASGARSDPFCVHAPAGTSTFADHDEDDTDVHADTGEHSEAPPSAVGSDLTSDTQNGMATSWARPERWSWYYPQTGAGAISRLTNPPVMEDRFLSGLTHLSLGFVAWLYDWHRTSKPCGKVKNTARAWRGLDSLSNIRSEWIAHVDAQVLGHVILQYFRTTEIGQAELPRRWEPKPAEVVSFAKLKLLVREADKTPSAWGAYDHSATDPVTMALTDVVVALMGHELTHELPSSVAQATIATLIMGNLVSHTVEEALAPMLTALLTIGRVCVLLHHQRVHDLAREGDWSVLLCSGATIYEDAGYTLMQWLKDNLRSPKVPERCETDDIEIATLRCEANGLWSLRAGFDYTPLARLGASLLDNLELSMARLLCLSRRQQLHGRDEQDRGCRRPPEIPWVSIVDEFEMTPQEVDEAEQRRGTAEYAQQGRQVSRERQDDGGICRTFVDYTQRKNPGCRMTQDAGWIRNTIQEAEDLQGHWLEGEVGGRRRFRHAAIREYGMLVNSFLRCLLSCLYFLSGEPLRLDELTHCLWRDSYDSRRNVGVWNGFVHLLFDFDYEYPPQLFCRMLPPRVAHCLVWYIWLVIPFESFLMAELGLDGGRSPYLFTDSMLAHCRCLEHPCSGCDQAEVGDTNNLRRRLPGPGCGNCSSGSPEAAPGFERRGADDISLAEEACYFEVEDIPKPWDIWCYDDDDRSRADASSVLDAGLRENTPVKNLCSLTKDAGTTTPGPHDRGMPWSAYTARRLLSDTSCHYFRPRSGPWSWQRLSNALQAAYFNNKTGPYFADGHVASEPACRVVPCERVTVLGGKDRYYATCVDYMDRCARRSHAWHCLMGVTGQPGRVVGQCRRETHGVTAAAQILLSPPSGAMAGFSRPAVPEVSGDRGGKRSSAYGRDREDALTKDARSCKRAKIAPALRTYTITRQELMHEPVLSTGRCIASTPLDGHSCLGRTNLSHLTGRRHIFGVEALRVVVDRIMEEGMKICMFCLAHGGDKRRVPEGGSICGVSQFNKTLRGEGYGLAFIVKNESATGGRVDGVVCTECWRPLLDCRASSVTCDEAGTFAFNLVLAICHRWGDNVRSKVSGTLRNLSTTMDKQLNEVGSWWEFRTWLGREADVDPSLTNLLVFISMAGIAAGQEELGCSISPVE